MRGLTPSERGCRRAGARIEDIRVLQGDSAAVAYGTGTYASRNAVLAGGAATLAARLLRERVIRAASYLLEASVEDIRAANGKVFLSGTDRSLTFREIAKGPLPEGFAWASSRWIASASS
jgi:aerobic carbon-monoxide dehydrogenase large subunit